MVGSHQLRKIVPEVKAAPVVEFDLQGLRGLLIQRPQARRKRNAAQRQHGGQLGQDVKFLRQEWKAVALLLIEGRFPGGTQRTELLM